ncbi:MAG: hypothetical protein KY456_15105 [Chloroflexi bacterium]|nr:hypothetical protein [Chloroflexota bacterium]
MGFVVTVGVLSVAAQDATPGGEQEEACATDMATAASGATAEATTATPAAEGCVAIESYDIYFDPNLVTIRDHVPRHEKEETFIRAPSTRSISQRRGEIVASWL